MKLGKNIFDGALAALLLLCAPALAEEPVAGEPAVATSEEEAPAPTWLNEPVTLGATIGFPNHVFSLGVPGATGDRKKNIDYSPPQAADLTVTAGYGAAQLSWSFPLPQSSAGRAAYGKGRYHDLKFEFGGERFATSLYYQSFGGFYTDLNGNTGNFARVGSGSSASSPEEAFPASSAVAAPQDILKRPDIRTLHLGVIGWYATPLWRETPQAFGITFDTLPGRPRPGFDLDLVTNTLFDHAEIAGSSPLVPGKKAELFSRRGAKLTRVDLSSAGLGAGLAASYVFESSRYFLDGLFLYGGGVQRQRALYTDDFRWATVYADNVNLRMGLNYRAARSQAGMHFWVNTVGSRVGDLRLSSSNMAFELSYQQTI